jgi:hypothetical protein
MSNPSKQQQKIVEPHCYHKSSVWVRIADNGSQQNSRRQKKPLIG